MVDDRDHEHAEMMARLRRHLDATGERTLGETWTGKAPVPSPRRGAHRAKRRRWWAPWRWVR